MWTAQGERIPGADVAGASPVPVQMWRPRAQPRCRCGRGVSPGRGIALRFRLQGVKVHCGIDDADVQEALAESKEITLER